MSKARAVQTPGESATLTDEGMVDAAAGGDTVLTDAGVDGTAAQIAALTAERDDLKAQVADLQARLAAAKANADKCAAKRPAAVPPVAEAPYLTEKGWIIPEPKKD